MMARFNVWLTNQWEGVFNSRPHAEIEYSNLDSIPFSIPKHNFIFILKKKATLFYFSAFNIYIYIYI